MIEKTIYESPIGKIEISTSSRGVMDLSFMASGKILEKPGDGPSNKFLRECVAQLDEYFDRRRTSFDIPLDLNGTPFQRTVWRALLLIPYGATWSYGKLASQIGRPNASRAVGGANHRNPVSIIVPCHRVIGGDGSLTGYGGGLWRKEWLLLHEANFKADVESE